MGACKRHQPHKVARAAHQVLRTTLMPARSGDIARPGAAHQCRQCHQCAQHPAGRASFIIAKRLRFFQSRSALQPAHAQPERVATVSSNPRPVSGTKPIGAPGLLVLAHCGPTDHPASVVFDYAEGHPVFSPRVGRRPTLLRFGCERATWHIRLRLPMVGYAHRTEGTRVGRRPTREQPERVERTFNRSIEQPPHSNLLHQQVKTSSLIAYDYANKKAKITRIL